VKPVVIIWAGMLAGVAMFTGVAAFVGPSMQQAKPEVFVWVMLAVSVMSAVMSRIVPRVTKANDAGKAIIGFALAEAGALTAGVAWMLSGDSRCLVGIGVGFLALASLFPRDRGEETERLVPPP